MRRRAREGRADPRGLQRRTPGDDALEARILIREVVENWDIAWTGFDIALAGVLAAVAVSAYRRSGLLPRLATAAGTALVCDAWFDVVTSARGEVGEAVLEAVLAELPLAAVCALIVFDVERFQRATVERYVEAVRRRRES